MAPLKIRNYAFADKDVLNGNGSPKGTNLDPADADQEAVDWDIIIAQAANYRIQTPANSYLPDMKVANPSLVMLLYMNTAFQGIAPGGGGAPPTAQFWQQCSADGSAYLRSKWGANAYLMHVDVDGGGWELSRIAEAEDLVAYDSTNVDGVFMDLAGKAPAGENYVEAPLGTPYKPRACPSGRIWTQAEWLGFTQRISTRVKDAIGDKHTFLNGFDADAYDLTRTQFTTGATWGLDEGYLRSAEAAVTAYPSETSWLRYMTLLGPLPASQGGGKCAAMGMTKVFVSATVAQVEAWREYGMATTLMGTDGGNDTERDRFCICTDRNNVNDMIPPDWYEWNIGTPTTAAPTGTSSKSQGVYKRTFTHGVVFVNPTGASATAVSVPTDGSYKNTSGTTVSGTVAVPANSGMILFKDASTTPDVNVGLWSPLWWSLPTTDAAWTDAFTRHNILTGPIPATRRTDAHSINPNIVLAPRNIGPYYDAANSDSLGVNAQGKVGVGTGYTVTEALYAHDGTGARISGFTATSRLLNMADARVRTFLVDAIETASTASGWDGAFIDQLGLAPVNAPVNADSYEARGSVQVGFSTGTVSAKPVKPGTSTAYTGAEWEALMVTFANAVKTRLGAKYVLVGGLQSSSQFPTTKALLDSTADGVVAEQWLRAPASSATAFPTAATWRSNMAMVTTAQAKGKDFLGWVKMWPTTAASDAENLAWARYALASVLMVQDDSGSVGLSYLQDKATTHAASSWNSWGSGDADLTTVGDPDGAAYDPDDADVSPFASTSTATVVKRNFVAKVDGKEVKVVVGLTFADGSVSVTRGTSTPTHSITSPTAASPSNITTTSMDVAWSTSTDSLSHSIARYDIRYSKGTFSAGTTVTSTSTSKSFNNLSSNTTYNFWVRAVCGNANPATSPWSAKVSATTTTPATHTVSTPSLAAASSIGNTTATLTWSASTDSTSGHTVTYTVELSTTSATAGFSENSTGISATTKDLTGLSSGTQYWARVYATCSGSGESGYSGVQTFTTTSHTITAPVQDTPTNPSYSQINTSWTASTDTHSIDYYEIEYSTNVDFSGASTTKATGLSARLTGLSASTAYYIHVRGRCVGSPVNISAWSNTQTITTSAKPADTTAPTTPGSVTATQTATGVTVTFTGSTDTESGVDDYDVYRQQTSSPAAGVPGTLVGTVAHTGAASYAVSDTDELAVGSKHVWRVFAWDKASSPNVSVAGASAELTIVDNIAPEFPEGAAVGYTATPGSVALTWTAATDNVAVDHYDVSRDGVVLDDPTATTYTDSTVADSTQYVYEVVAVDAAGNESDALSITLTSAPASGGSSGFEIGIVGI